MFYINLPIGLLCTLGVLVFIRHSRNIHREPFDVVGFLALSLGIGALQLLLDIAEAYRQSRGTEGSNPVHSRGESATKP